MRILTVYLEPTPYLLGLLDVVRHKAGSEINSLFIGENISQSWNLTVDRSSGLLPDNGYFSAMTHINAMLKANSYDVIHLAGWGNRVLLSILLLAWFKHLPVVVESDTQLPFGQAAWKRFLKALIYPFLFRIPAMFLPGGTRQAQYLRHYGVRDAKISIAKMTVDVAGIIQSCRALGKEGRKQTRAKYGFSDANVVFIFVGRLLEHKGIRHLIEAFQDVSLKNPDVRLLVVGDGPELDLVQRAAKENSAIRWAGRLDFPAVIEACHASDVCIVPSLFEPWGLVVNEAMAAGLPVIATERVGCIDDLVIKEETGFIVPAGDIQALTTAILHISDKAGLRTTLGMQARKLISSWTLEEEAELIIEVWRKVAHNED